MGITSDQSHRLGVDDNEKKKKEQKEIGKNDNGIVKVEQGKDEKERKINLGRKIEDGRLPGLSIKIYGQNLKALIDNSATRFFVTPTCVTVCGLKAKRRYVFLELGNGEKFLSRGFVPDIP